MKKHIKNTITEKRIQQIHAVLQDIHLSLQYGTSLSMQPILKKHKVGKLFYKVLINHGVIKKLQRGHYEWTTVHHPSRELSIMCLKWYYQHNRKQAEKYAKKRAELNGSKVEKLHSEQTQMNKVAETKIEDDKKMKPSSTGLREFSFFWGLIKLNY